jgi:hypothetical protein
MNKADVLLKALGIEIGGEMDVNKINEVFRNFKEAKKILDDYEKKTLKPFLFQSAESLGLKTETGGNRVQLEDGTGWEKQARTSVSVDEDKALELFSKKGLYEFIDKEEVIAPEDNEKVINILKSIERTDLITTNESVPVNNVEQAYLMQFINDDELSELISKKVTYALVEVKPAKPVKK